MARRLRGWRGARGWRVGVNYRSDKAAAEGVTQAVRAAGGEAMLLPGDVGEEADIEAMFDAFTQQFGGVDAVSVNAGVLGLRGPLVDIEAERIAQILKINVYGALLTARAAARRMSRSRGGSGGAIMMLSSAAARLGSPNEFVDYAASKGAIDTLTLGLSKELGPEGIRVNAVRPGVIETDMHQDTGWADRAKTLGAQTPLGRSGSSEEVAESVIWLLSDAASYVTGAILDVTGGR